jgi:hypothetical protein
MHQRGGVKCVPGVLCSHPRSREFSQFAVNEGEQVGRCLAVASRGGNEELSDLWHNPESKADVAL